MQQYLLLLLLIAIAITGCSTTDWPQSKPGLYNWYTSDASQELVDQRYEHASVKSLGTKADIANIRTNILNNKEHVCSQVKEIRWVSPTQAMAKAGIYGPNVGSSEYTFVLEKNNGIWKVVACYMDWIS
jgi:hypothetical protein